MLTCPGLQCSAYLGVLVDQAQVAEGCRIHAALDQQLFPHCHRHLQHGQTDLPTGSGRLLMRHRTSGHVSSQPATALYSTGILLQQAEIQAIGASGV